MSRWNRISLSARIEERVVIISESGCWIWLGRVHPKTGYGIIRYNGVSMGAHRASAVAFLQGSISGKMICHHCDVTSCVNPEHLYVGNAKTNSADRSRRGRVNPPAGIRCASAKLTEAEVLEIRASTAKGGTLARYYNISQSIFSQIRSRQIWRHL